jgi:branched-chain amino acid transport system substrate-binding protein
VAIGNTGTYSGVIGAVFAPALTGLQLWVQAANACGGLNGHPIRLISADDQGDPSTALTETEQQVESEHVIAEVSVFSPFSAPTVLPYLEQEGIPEIGGCNCAPENEWWDSGDVFPAGAGWNPYGAAPAILAHAAGHSKVAIFYCIEAPSQCGSLAANSKSAAATLGMSVVEEQAVSLTAPSFAAQCDEAQSAGATALLVYLDGGSIQRFADDCASTLNYKPQFFTVGLAITPQVVTDSNLNGLEAPSQTFPWSYGGTPATAAYQNAIRQYDPSFSSAGPAAASWASGVLAQVGSYELSAGNPTPAQFVKGLQALKNENLGGLVASASYGPSGATAPNCVFVNEIVDNKWTAPNGLQQLCQ